MVKISEIAKQQGVSLAEAARMVEANPSAYTSTASTTTPKTTTTVSTPAATATKTTSTSSSTATVNTSGLKAVTVKNDDGSRTVVGYPTLADVSGLKPSEIASKYGISLSKVQDVLSAAIANSSKTVTAAAEETPTATTVPTTTSTTKTTSPALTQEATASLTGATPTVTQKSVTATQAATPPAGMSTEEWLAAGMPADRIGYIHKKLNDTAIANPYWTADQVANYVKDQVGYDVAEDSVYNLFYGYYQPKTATSNIQQTSLAVPSSTINTADPANDYVATVSADKGDGQINLVENGETINLTGTTAVSETRAKVEELIQASLSLYQELPDLVAIRADLKETLGANTVFDNISDIDDTILQRQQELQDELGDLQENNWLSDANREGKNRVLLETAYDDINALTARRNSYVDEYNSILSDIDNTLKAYQDNYDNARTMQRDLMSDAATLWGYANQIKSETDEAAQSAFNYYSTKLTDGSIDYSSLTSAEKESLTKIAIAAGMPATVFSQIEAPADFSYVGQDVIYDAMGNGTMVVTYRDDKTGELSIKKISIGTDASKATSMVTGSTYYGQNNASGYPVTQNSDGSITLGVVDFTYGGQCGRFANNYLGSAEGGVFGDPYEQKVSQINTYAPQVGAVGVMKITGSENGHVFVVEKIYTDAQGNPIALGVVDSNWGNDELIQRHKIGVSEVTGYYVPKTSSLTAKDAVEFENKISEAAAKYQKLMAEKDDGVAKYTTEAAYAQAIAGMSGDLSKYATAAGMTMEEIQGQITGETVEAEGATYETDASAYEAAGKKIADASGGKFVYKGVDGDVLIFTYGPSMPGLSGKEVRFQVDDELNLVQL